MACGCMYERGRQTETGRETVSELVMPVGMSAGHLNKQQGWFNVLAKPCPYLCAVPYYSVIVTCGHVCMPLSRLMIGVRVPNPLHEAHPRQMLLGCKRYLTQYEAAEQASKQQSVVVTLEFLASLDDRLNYQIKSTLSLPELLFAQCFITAMEKQTLTYRPGKYITCEVTARVSQNLREGTIACVSLSSKSLTCIIMFNT